MIKTAYYGDKSVTYGMSHTRLKRILEFIPRGCALRVLDVGCANGRLGKEIKKLGHFVAGIEISPQAAQNARQALDEVYVFDIEGEWPKKLEEQKFDLVVLPEILEHIFDPVYVLRKSSAVLKEGGEIIITTPNFMVWTNRIRFLFGRFKYGEQGMFDFGHIRWFTYRYLHEVLAQSGFQIIYERHIIFPGKLTKILKHWPGLFAFQFVIKAKKTGYV